MIRDEGKLSAESPTAVGDFRPFPVFDRWREKAPILGLLLPLLCALPLLAGVSQRFMREKFDYVDFQTVLCAGWRAARDLPVYTANFTCPGMVVSCPDYPYLYAPWLYRVMAGALQTLGEGPLWFLFLLAHWGGAALIIAVTLNVTRNVTQNGREWSFESVASRAPLLAMWTGAAMAWGNIGLGLHAMVLGAALMIPRRPMLFVLAVAVVAALKPQFVIYACVLPFAIRPFWRGCALGALAVVAGLAPTALSFVAEHPQIVESWRDAYADLISRGHIGDTVLSWLSWLGVDPHGRTATVASGLFAAVMLWAGFMVARSADLSVRDKALLGVAVVLMASPRLMQYDVLTMAPGVVVLLAAARRRNEQMFQVASLVVLVACLAPFVLQNFGLRDEAFRLRQLALAGVALTIGYAYAPQWWRGFREYFAIKAPAAGG